MFKFIVLHVAPVAALGFGLYFFVRDVLAALRPLLTFTVG